MTASNGPALPANLLRLQLEELLKGQSPDYVSRIRKSETWLAEIQQTLSALLPEQPYKKTTAGDFLGGNAALKAPLSPSIPETPANIRYGFAPPSKMGLVGSFPLGTYIRRDSQSLIDLSVTMPDDLLEEKDYLDYRYVHKLAHYLACLARGLQQQKGQSNEVSYSYQDDNILQPCILVSSKSAQIHGHPWQRVRILVGPPPTAFKMQRLQPWSPCIRPPSEASSTTTKERQCPTPLYNGTIVAGVQRDAYAVLTSATAQACPGFTDACKLTRIWLRQRGFGSGLCSGGFGNFEAACCLALLLKTKASASSNISVRSDALQLFMALLQFLSHKNVVKEPHIVGKLEVVWQGQDLDVPLLYDADRSHNILFKMSVASYQSLKVVAQSTCESFLQPDPLRFHPIFIAKPESMFVKYDFVLTMNMASGALEVLQRIDALFKLLATAFTDRVRLIDVRCQTASTSLDWPCSCPPPQESMHRTFEIGLLASAAEVARRVDLGPASEDTRGAAEYRDFWGAKAELRRFTNGEIRESVTWPSPDNDYDILNNIMSWVTTRHSSHGILESTRCLGTRYEALHFQQAAPQALLPFAKVEKAFQQLQECVTTLSDQPLRLRQVSASDAGLRYASISARWPRPAPAMHHAFNVVVQFEGSMRWPEDMQAVENTKIALLSKLAMSLEDDSRVSRARVGLENIETPLFNQSHLDVSVLDTTFRIRVHHDRQETLLERLITDKTVRLHDREPAVNALFAYKRIFVNAALHTQAIRELCAKMPLVSSAMRITKSWFSSHLLSSHFSEELIEILVIHVFTAPWPYSSPGSLRSAFVRTLVFIAKWDWLNEPLVVDLTGKGLTRTDVDGALDRFRHWRKTDPAMHRVTLFVSSNIEPDGLVWTSPKPSVVAINRLSALANAAVNEVARQGLSFTAEPLFTRSLIEYDFVIHVRSKADRISTHSMDSIDPISGLQMINAFVQELEQVFSGFICFFHDQERQPVIGGLWLSPVAARDWKIGTSWGTYPQRHENGSIGVNLNAADILGQIAQLGGPLVSQIDTLRSTD